MKKEKKSLLKPILLIVGIIIIIFVALVAYLVINDLKQEDILKQEIVNLTNKDLLTDDYYIKVKTTGDYAYIEEAIKKFYKELSDNVKTMNQYLNDEKLINILSADNLQADGPKFLNSYYIIEETRKNSTTALQNIAKLCEEENLKNLIDKEKVDDYSYELYLQLMYTEDDLESFKETKKQMEEYAENLNLFLDKVTEMLKMLERNSDAWEIADGQIYFDTNALVNEYNTLYDELNKIAIEKFGNKEATTNKTNNSI